MGVTTDRLGFAAHVGKDPVLGARVRVVRLLRGENVCLFLL